MLRTSTALILWLAACDLPGAPKIRSEVVAVAGPGAAGKYAAFAVWIDEFVVAGAHGHVLLGGVDSDTTLGAVDYAPALPDTGTDATIHGLARRFGSSTMIAVGDGGVIRRSEDRGMTWAAVESGTTADLYAAAFPHWETTAEAIVVVGDGVMLRSADQGLTWSPLPLPAGDEQLRDVASVLGLGWYAVGLDGVILSAQGDAEAWVAEPSPTTHDLQRVSGDFGPAFLIVGAEDVLVTRDDDGWHEVQLPLTGEIADATVFTLVMRDGRIGRKELQDPPDGYILSEPTGPLPLLRRIVLDTQRYEANRTLMLAEDGSLVMVAYSEAHGP